MDLKCIPQGVTDFLGLSEAQPSSQVWQLSVSILEKVLVEYGFLVSLPRLSGRSSTPVIS